MHLTVQADYALRTLMFVGLKGERLSTIAEIAAAYDISANHLMKVVHQLGVAGYVETIRGKKGGLRLARPAAAINLGELVRRIEPDLALVPCFAADAACAIQPACALQRVLGEALAAFLGVLDDYVLADLLARPRRLAALLAIDPPAPIQR